MESKTSSLDLLLSLKSLEDRIKHRRPKVSETIYLRGLRLLTVSAERKMRSAFGRGLAEQEAKDPVAFQKWSDEVVEESLKPKGFDPPLKRRKLTSNDKPSKVTLSEAGISTSSNYARASRAESK